MTFNTPNTQFDTVIIRLAGEIGIKANWTRKLYERRLVSNVKAALKHHAISYDTLTRRFGRVYLETSQARIASQKLAKVFGISSISPSLRTASELTDIVKGSIFVASQRLREGKSFAVRCRRIGKHAYTSQEVCREVGRQILNAFSGLHLSVNLKHPDVTIGIEIREAQAFIYADVFEGVGGLPLGTQPKVVCLLDENIDSSVACWLVMKRGCPILPLYFDNTPFSDGDATEATLETARVLFNWAFGFPRKVHIVPNSENLVKIRRECPKELTDVISRRLTYRVAERLAEAKGAEGIVSGESLGEKPIRTLSNIHILDEAVKLYPIHRPLLGLTKTEIRQLARKIEMPKNAQTKIGKREEVPIKTTAITLEDVRAIEKKLSVAKMVEVSLRSLRILNL